MDQHFEEGIRILSSLSAEKTGFLSFILNADHILYPIPTDLITLIQPIYTVKQLLHMHCFLESGCFQSTAHVTEVIKAFNSLPCRSYNW